MTTKRTKKLNHKKRPNGAGAVAPASSPFNSRLSVYDGQNFIGYLLPADETGFHAFDCDDRPIGTYPTLRTAMRAVPVKVEIGRG